MSRHNHFDAERFITEIELRRGIWDLSSSDYSNKDIKRQLWMELTNIFGGEKLEVKEKTELHPDEGTESVQRADVLCNNCENVIVGFRYKCITCEDYNLCKKCETMETHSEHYVLRIPKPLECEEAAEIVQKLQQIFKPEEDVPQIKEEDPIGDGIGECGDDEPIKDRNVEGDIHLSKQIKNIIHIEVSRVMEESKDIGEPPATVRRKKKRTPERETGGGGKRMCDAIAKVNAAPEIVFADANSDFDTQDSSKKVDVKQEMYEESEIISRFDVGETVNPYMKDAQL